MGLGLQFNPTLEAAPNVPKLTREQLYFVVL